MKNRWTFAFMMPIIALGATIKIFAVNPYYSRYFYTLPIIFISKLAWCFGALSVLKK